MAEVPSGTKESRYQDAQGNWVERKWQIQTRPFSDNIVVFMPTESGSISSILFMVRYLHDRIVELELCIRGAVTIGNMFWDEAWSNPIPDDRLLDGGQEILYHRGQNNLPVTLGPGLIKAYKLESQCAIYPRVIIDRKMHNYLVEKALNCFPFGTATSCDLQLKDLVRKDADGLFFLDILNSKVNRNDTERIIRTQAGDQFSITWERDNSTHDKVMGNIRRLIEKNCESEDEKLCAKYGWLKSYYDSIAF